MLFSNIPGPFIPNLNRAIGVDYTWPLYDDHYKIVVPLRPYNNFALFISVFNSEVWIAVLISIPVVFLAMMLADLIFSRATNWEANIGFVLSKICADSTFETPNEHLYQKVFVLTWLVAVFFLVSGYAGNLKSIQSQPRIERKIKTAKDLVSQDEIPWVLQEDETFHVWGTNLPYDYESPQKTLVEKAALLSHDEEWYGFCFSEETKQDNKYAAVCLGLGVRDLLARDFSSSGTCNFYNTEDTFLAAPVTLLIQVWKHFGN